MIWTEVITHIKVKPVTGYTEPNKKLVSMINSGLTKLYPIKSKLQKYPDLIFRMMNAHLRKGQYKCIFET